MAELTDRLIQAYRDWTPTSEKRMEEARRYLPGGDTRSSAHYSPYPAFMVGGKGSRLTDVDGHEYVDFMNNFTSLIHGHGHPPTAAAVAEQIARGSAYAAPSESQVELARILCERVPSLDELRFCSSGTEATSLCVRAARAHNGKPKIVKVEGGYHGSHDIGEISLVPRPGKSGPLESPEALIPDRSFAESSLDEVIVTPFNEPEITRQQIEARADEICALIIEPMMGAMGMIPPQEGYLEALREITLENEVVLIFDEVVTLRVALGGVQDWKGVTPDLTAMGKIIGGGLPIGAFGGRRDLVEQFNPDRRDTIMHASTFSGNALTMAAGIAALRHYEQAEIERINGLGARLRAGMNGAFRKAGIRGQATGYGSLSRIHLSDRAIRHARDSVQAVIEAGAIPRLLHLGMLRRGVFGAGSLMYCTSTAMAEADVDLAAGALLDTLVELRPAVEEECPTLLA